MVNMNASAKARHISSIVNQNQGGGSKKAGLVPTEAISAAQREAYSTRGYLKSVKTMQMTLHPNVPSIKKYWNSWFIELALNSKIN